MWKTYPEKIFLTNATNKSRCLNVEEWNYASIYHLVKKLSGIKDLNLQSETNNETTRKKNIVCILHNIGIDIVFLYSTTLSHELMITIDMWNFIQLVSL